MAKKVKIYLDTSVVSCLQVPETPERMEDTLRLWEDLEATITRIYTIGYFKRKKLRRLHAHCNSLVSKMRCYCFMEF